MRPKGLIPDTHLVLYMIVDAPGDADASRVGQPLHPGRDVDPVPVDVSPILDHIPEIDPDYPSCGILPEDPRFLPSGRSGFPQRTAPRPPRCRNRREECRRESPYPAAVLFGEGTDDLEMGFQRGEGPGFVLPHEAAVPPSPAHRMDASFRLRCSVSFRLPDSRIEYEEKAQPKVVKEGIPLAKTGSIARITIPLLPRWCYESVEDENINAVERIYSFDRELAKYGLANPQGRPA